MGIVLPKVEAAAGVDLKMTPSSGYQEAIRKS
jgi:hypothetical protein